MTPNNDEKIMAVIVNFYDKWEIPQLLNIHKRVHAGGRLNDRDIAVMRDIYAGIHKHEPLFQRHPEYQPLFSKVVHLYTETTEKALSNED